MSDIKYYSTNLKAEKVSFSEALLKGLAPDGGLYMPEQIPRFSKDEIASFSKKEYHEIAFFVLQKFLGETIPSTELAGMTKQAYNFDVPLEKVYDNKYVMRLDQGPTASFKDFAARMMGQLMQYFLKQEHRNMLILTATSGDTGSAMANAFYGLRNINIAVLFPENEVTPRQRKQMTTLHENVQILSLDGKFDDCQALVKQAFNDPELDYLNLSSANSINIGRLLPQSVYYIYAYSRLCDIEKGDEIVFSVPSGNFGDLMGGLLAMKMGLPVKKFVVSTNANDEVPVYFATGNYKTIVPSENCISSAMNVGHPSNMARIVALYGGIMNADGEILKKPDLEKMKEDMFATSVDDSITRETIKRVYDRHKVILEPHGAVGWEGLRQFMNCEKPTENQVCVSLETAHPAKFPEEVELATGIDPELPVSLSKLDDKEEQFDKLESGYENFKIYLKSKYGA
ncbi:MAG: threonine synthase [Bacteroidales bacterium]|nr:threonine synthase [Bacteroidales bacterium]MBN2819359.1 threonine synthase [Bacteroidales bacterium]